MLEGEILAGIESLERLKIYYQNEYERYLAKAMTAKAHREKIEVLLQDLDDKMEDATVEPSLRGWKRNEDVHLLEAQSEKVNGYFVQDKSLASSGSENGERKVEDTADLEDASAVASFLELSKTVMPAIKKVFESEPNKTLHLSYLQKILNSKLNLQLSAETVKLYLNQAIERDYCHLDSFDRECYTASDFQGDELVTPEPNLSSKTYSNRAEPSLDKPLGSPSTSTKKISTKVISDKEGTILTIENVILLKG